MAVREGGSESVGVQAVSATGVPLESPSLELRLPALPVMINTDAAREVLIEHPETVECHPVVGAPGPTQHLEITCPVVDGSEPLRVSVPEGIDLTVVGGREVSVSGRLGAVEIPNGTRSASLDGLYAYSIRGTVHGDVVGFVDGASSIDVTSLTGRVDLQLATVPRTTSITAPDGDVSLALLSPSPVTLDLKSTEGTVRSDVTSSGSAPSKITVEARHRVVVTDR